ncbi:hypothetical protein GLOIN_2v1843805 [Rhizophagus irregularis DAOM 181602=DAOM 197198]|nr:hypothetical protein GLOIN_2v1843805 [Rhizophagus irregularis DAOM 181602=DAOM 197198]
MSYSGQKDLISYLNERGNNWQDLNNTWISHFLEEVEKLDLYQEDFKEKINVEYLHYRELKRVKDDNRELTTEH